MLLYLSDSPAGDGETLFPLLSNHSSHSSAQSKHRCATCGSGDFLNMSNCYNCLQREPCQGGTAGLRVQPKRGTTLLWYNYDVDGRPFRQAVHAGCPPRRADASKYAMNIWIRQKLTSFASTTFESAVISNDEWGSRLKRHTGRQRSQEPSTERKRARKRSKKKSP